MSDKKIRKYWLKLMRFFAPTCHQIPERSFFFFGYQFFVCARCTGLYLGYIFGILAALFGIRTNIVVDLIMIFPLILDGVIQLLGYIESNNARRFLTGLMCGIGIVMLILKLFNF